jgi:hypothetical protein
MGLTDFHPPLLTCHEHKLRLRLTLIDFKMLPEPMHCVTPVLLQTCLKIEHPFRQPSHIFMWLYEDKFKFPGFFNA